MSQKNFRLWVDGQCFQTGSRLRGIGRYVEQLLGEISTNCAHIDLHLSLNAAMAPEAVAARDFLQKIMPRENIHVWHGVAEDGEALFGLTENRRLSEIALAYHAASLNPDVIFSVSPFEGAYDNAVPLLPNDICGVPMASIFYDAIPLRFSERYLPDEMARQCYQRRLEALRGFDLNLCISDFAKREALELLGPNNAVEMSAGISKQFLNRLRHDGSRQFEPNTLLYVGGFDWRKNVTAVVSAIGKLHAALRQELKFVVIGDLNPIAERKLRSMWSDLRLPADNLRLIGHVSDNALVEYYLKVAAVIQPSLMEGFGLTALEAVLCGTPVIASNAGALPEIILDKHFLFDPTDPDDIASHISKVLRTASAGQISSEALSHARSFTWERTAAIAIDSMTALLGPKTDNANSPTIDRAAIAAARKIKQLKTPVDFAANCMARAVPRAPGKQPLIVDATSTVITDGRSGIQRVVKSICANLLPSHSVSVHVAFSDNETDWYEVEDGRIHDGPEMTKERARKLFFGSSDRILMLDSSWTFHRAHSHSLMSARMRGAEVVTCLYDTIPLRASGFCHMGMPPVFSSWFQAALTYSTGFVCISKAVADELIDILRSIRFPRPLNVGYWPLGADFQSINQSAAEQPDPGDAQNFLMVGTLEPRKGHRVALEAFDLLWKRGENVRLTIVGKLGWSATHLVSMIESHPEWGTRLQWHKNVTDEELQGHYRQADCLIASSFAEGFGLPIIEAGYLGKPIIASDIPVFREVASRTPDSKFFELGSAASLADAVLDFLQTNRSQVSSEQPSWESWKDSAKRLKDIILNDDWYVRYEPDLHNSLGLPHEIGNVATERPLAKSERRQTLSFFEGPHVADEPKAVKFVVKIRNDSDVVWSSKGPHAVYLGAKLYNQRKSCLKEGPKASIPFVIAPQDTIYLPINVPVSWLKGIGNSIHLEMSQDGVGWWGNPIVLPVKELTRPRG